MFWIYVSLHNLFLNEKNTRVSRRVILQLWSELCMKVRKWNQTLKIKHNYLFTQIPNTIRQFSYLNSFKKFSTENSYTSPYTSTRQLWVSAAVTPRAYLLWITTLTSFFTTNSKFLLIPNFVQFFPYLRKSDWEANLCFV